MTARTGIAMTETLKNAALIRLMSWMSPSFPVGAFAYSSGLEAAIHCKRVCDAEAFETWLADLLAFGQGWNDAVLMAESWRRGENGDLGALMELGEAMASSAGRHRETMNQGAAFLEAAAAWPHPRLAELGPRCPLPVAAGATCAIHGLPLEASISAYLQAYVSNQIQAAMRLMQLGQQEGVRILARTEAAIATAASQAARSDLDALGGPAILAEIAAMQHETLRTRLFRS
ncbi:MAG: urease accessory protein UreF [Pseudomonadota bacterium]